jgi:tetratricopeptide (TPR) repeat protein
MYRAVLEAEPENSDAMQLLALLMVQAGRQEIAVDWFRKAAELRPDLAGLQYNLAHALQDTGQLKAAEAAYRRAAALQPEFPEAYVNLASVLLQLGERDAAAACCERALALKPDLAEAHNNLGDVLRDEGRTAEAIQRYKQALNLKPGLAEARRNLVNASIDTTPSPGRPSYSSRPTDGTMMPDQRGILQLLGMLRPYSARCSKLRIGALGDGGYVINDDLSRLDGLISIGIGADASFDFAFAERGVRVFQYDPTVEASPLDHANFLFRKLGWARDDTESSRSLETMIIENSLNDTNNLVLKFDVEGAEWDALQSVSAATLSKFRMIVGEFHWLDRMVQGHRFQLMWNIFSALSNSHVVTHLHANNCCGVSLVEGVVIPRLLEVSLLRRDRSSFVEAYNPMPTALDCPNIAGMPELVLTPFW